MTEIAIAILGGAAGALITTLLRIRHERETEFRDRLARAADDFVTGVAEAMLAVRDVGLAIESGKPAEEVDVLQSRAEDSIDVVFARHPRIRLLFGVSSPAGQAANETITHLRAARQATLREPDLNASRRALVLANRESETFSGVARDAVRGQSWWQSVSR